MLVKDLFEDVESDVELSRYGEITRLALINHLSRYGFSAYSTDKSVAVVDKFRTNNTLLDKVVNKNLHVRFAAGDDAYFATMYKNTTPVISLGIGKLLSVPTAIDFLQSNDGASTFRHEYQHMINNMHRHKKDVDVSYNTKDAQSDRKQYYNDPQELNSFFHELAEPLLKVLRAALSVNKNEMHSVNKIDPDFKRYLNIQMRFDTPLSGQNMLFYLNDKNNKKVLKRLYALHKAAVEIQGVAEPYQLKTAQKVELWLGAFLRKSGIAKPLRKWLGIS